MTTLLLAIALALTLPCGADVAVTAYAVAVEDPDAIPNASLERTDAELVVRFQAPAEGTYRVGLRIEAAEITPLSPGMPVFTPADEPTALRHPYDWTYVGARNVLSVRPRLVMPGVAVGERVYLIDTRELTAVHLEPVGGDAVAALLLAHRYYNDGADAATPDLHLVAGELVELTIRVFDTLTDAKLARYGVRPAMTGRMYFAWDEFAKDFRERRTWVSAELDLPWEEGLAPLVGTNLCYGVKGISPVAVQSAAHFIRRPTGLMYLGTGDFLPDELDAWLDTVVALATEDELYVTAIEPADRRLHFAGRDGLRVDEGCTITLSRPACLLDEAGECLAHQVETVALSPDTRYRLVTKCRCRSRERQSSESRRNSSMAATNSSARWRVFVAFASDTTVS